MSSAMCVCVCVKGEGVQGCHIRFSILYDATVQVCVTEAAVCDMTLSGSRVKGGIPKCWYVMSQCVGGTIELDDGPGTWGLFYAHATFCIVIT